MGLTVPHEGAVMVRLQSYAETGVNCRLSIPFPFTQAHRTSYLGLTQRELDPEPEGTVSVDVPAFGTAAVIFRLAPSKDA
ncbi:hypothetical protein ACIPN8_43265 [Streptomyces sp. NPDC086082]|uniref:hypothetical protein n=1 Tax=Streptomyces sp. NPDC086082 TaxID=3365750 RepID=UPI00381D2E21